MECVNIEMKARCENLDKIRSILQNKEADFKGLDHQVDTYFNANYGRLKLREGNIENALIHYKREDKVGAKESSVLLYKSVEGKSLKEVLAASLGVFKTVDKKREIYFIENVKFHLDSVKGLGTFIEIEAIGEKGADKEKLSEQCDFYLNLFEVDKNDYVSCSYSDIR